MSTRLSITEVLRRLPRLPRPAVTGDADKPEFRTINGAAVPIGEGGELKGKVGEKIKADTGSKKQTTESISITGNELGDYADARELRRKAVGYYKENLQGQPAHRDDIGEIRFSRKGLEETRTFSADTDKLLLLPALRSIIETGRLGQEEKPNHARTDGIVAFLPITQTVDFKGKPKSVEVLLGKDRHGNLYYDLFLDNSRKKESPDSGVGQNLRLSEDSKAGVYPAHDLNITFPAFPVNDGLALDTATCRRIDENGFLHVSLSHISKETVNPYYGREIPGGDILGLDPGRIYYGYRAGSALAKGAETFNGLPILMGHHAESAEAPQKDHRVGSLGTDAAFNAPYLDNSLIITDAEAILAIESGRAVELSSAYRYDPVFEAGEFEGEHYDFIMTNIRGNHVALVEEGRAGPDVVVADRQINPHPLRRIGMGIKELIDKLKAFIASAEESGAKMDPDSLDKGKELINDMGAFIEGQAGGQAQDDELGDLGAEIYALIDTIEDRELAAKIKGKIEEARAAADPSAKDSDPAGEPAKKAEDNDPAAKAEKPLTAQDAALIRKQAKQEASAETMAHIRALNNAAQAVRGLCGELDPLAFDSAADIYRHALKASGRTVSTRDAAALRDMVAMALDAKSVTVAAQAPAFDSAEMTGQFAGLSRINLS